MQNQNSKNYYIKNIIFDNTDKINNVYYWRHETLKECAIWNTKTIKINSENGIKCMSNKNKNIYLDFILEYYSKGIYYIKMIIIIIIYVFQMKQEIIPMIIILI